MALLAVALCAATLTTCAVALADDSSMGAGGGTVHPIWTTNVRLAAETVQADCFGSFAEYRVDFEFVNDGKPRLVKLGFPFTDTVPGEHGTERPVGFQAWQNGRPLAVRAVAATWTKNESVGYFMHEALFPHGASMITVSYLAEESSTAMERPKSGATSMAAFYQYWLHTGSTWKGPIDKAVVRYRFADTFRGSDIELTKADASSGAPLTTPPGWTTPLPRTYQWQFLDFEPTTLHATSRASDWWRPQSRYDINLAFDSPMTPAPTEAGWTWSSIAPSSDFGDKEYPTLQDGDLSSCWAEGVPGLGVGQWVKARFKRPVRLRELRILPGNNAYDAAFTQFARPKTLTAIFSDGSSATLRLRDAPMLQRFPVSVTTRTVKFVIRSVYRGAVYPATCISEVEFGTQRAPGYAPFKRLIADPLATGTLSAWAGPAARAPQVAGDRGAPEAGTGAVTDARELEDADAYGGGDLIGVGEWAPFPADTAPFAEPSSLAALEAKDLALQLPAGPKLGAPVTVSALSYQTWAVGYSSGVDLLVNTDLSTLPRESLAATLAAETEDMAPYTDHRKQPFELATVGRQTIGVARAGELAYSDWQGTRSTVVPGAVFWRAGDASYHLYARSKTVTTAALVALARSMIEPRPPAVAHAHGSTRPWWLGLGALGGAAIVATAAVVARRQKKGAPAPQRQTP